MHNNGAAENIHADPVIQWRRAMVYAILRAPYIAVMCLFITVIFFTPTTRSWCQICTQNRGEAPTCTSWDLAHSLNAALGFSLHSGGGSLGWVFSDNDTFAPVYAALLKAQKAVFSGYICLFVTVCGILCTRILPERIKEYVLHATILIYYTCILFSSFYALILSTIALKQWQQGLWRTRRVFEPLPQAPTYNMVQGASNRRRPWLLGRICN